MIARWSGWRASSCPARLTHSPAIHVFTYAFSSLFTDDFIYSKHLHWTYPKGRGDSFPKLTHDMAYSLPGTVGYNCTLVMHYWISSFLCVFACVCYNHFTLTHFLKCMYVCNAGHYWNSHLSYNPNYLKECGKSRNPNWAERFDVQTLM